MKAVRYHEHGGPEVLRIDDIDRPDPEPDELLVEIRAASVNPVDTTLREGLFGSLSLPAIPGGDAAGEVAAVGEDVESFAVGDQVFLGGVGQVERGTAAEYVAIPTIKAAHLPESVSFEEGAAIPNVGATAWTALFDIAELGPTDRCLIHGGAGGVGHAAVQLATSTVFRESSSESTPPGYCARATSAHISVNAPPACAVVTPISPMIRGKSGESAIRAVIISIVPSEMTSNIRRAYPRGWSSRVPAALSVDTWTNATASGLNIVLWPPTGAVPSWPPVGVGAAEWF